MFDSAFHLICNQQLSQSGILSRKGKIIQDYGAPETDQIIELLNKVSGDDEIRCVNEPPNYHLVFIYLKGFEDFQMVIKRKGDSASFSAADQEYIQSIINLIRISRYNIEELLKEPNVLKALFKIQADLDSILYIKINHLIVMFSWRTRNNHGFTVSAFKCCNVFFMRIYYLKSNDLIW